MIIIITFALESTHYWIATLTCEKETCLNQDTDLPLAEYFENKYPGSPDGVMFIPVMMTLLQNEHKSMCKKLFIRCWSKCISILWLLKTNCHKSIALKTTGNYLSKFWRPQVPQICCTTLLKVLEEIPSFPLLVSGYQISPWLVVTKI